MAPEPESRYAPNEFFDRYFDFLKDPQVQARLRPRNIRTHEHEDLLIWFITYVKNTSVIEVKRTSERKKIDVFKDTGVGMLLTLDNIIPWESKHIKR